MRVIRTSPATARHPGPDDPRPDARAVAWEPCGAQPLVAADGDDDICARCGWLADDHEAAATLEPSHTSATARVALRRAS